MTIRGDETAALDSASEDLGLPRLLLMENAGSSVARRLLERFGRKKVLVLAGTGNNGGDGMVAARHLSNFGCEVHLILIGEPGSIRTEETMTNWKIIEKLKAVEKKSLSELDRELQWADVVVDAILGTGVRGELREPILSIVKKVNKAGKPVIAVDTPTGLDPSTGRICGEAIRARLTVTFHAAKAGFVGREEFVGEVIVEDIGIPRELEERVLGRRLEIPSGPSPILVSACLLGINCRYDGGNSLNEKVLFYVSGRFVLPICPEQMGGLPTPRSPNYIQNGSGLDVLEGRANVVNADGVDVTENFIKGAKEVLTLAKRFGAREAILKAGSPSCGVGWISMGETRREGDGVTTALLRREGIVVKSEEGL